MENSWMVASPGKAMQTARLRRQCSSSPANLRLIAPVGPFGFGCSRWCTHSHRPLEISSVLCVSNITCYVSTNIYPGTRSWTAAGRDPHAVAGVLPPPRIPAITYVD